MGARRTVLIKLHEAAGSGNCGVPWLLCDVAEWAEGLLAEVPPEHREKVRIELGSESEWDGHVPNVEVSYSRPETDEEFNSRQAAEQRAQAVATRERERHERAQLAALQAKYGAT